MPRTRASSSKGSAEPAEGTPNHAPTPRRLTRSALRSAASQPPSDTQNEADDTFTTAIEGPLTSPAKKSPKKGKESRAGEVSSRESSKSRLEVEEHLTGRSSTASPAVAKNVPLPPSSAQAARATEVEDTDEEDEEDAEGEETTLLVPGPSTFTADEQDSSSDSEEDSSSDSDSVSDSSSSSLDDLLAALRSKYADAEAAAAAEAISRPKGGEAFADGDEVVRFDDDDEDAEESDDDEIVIAGSDRRATKKMTDSELSLKRLSRPLTLGPLPPLTARPHPRPTSDPPLPPSHAKGKSKSKPTPPDRFGLPPLAPPSKQRRPSSRPLAFHDLPLTPPTPETRREIQALRLHNSLDPKRFYKGGGGNGMKDPVPERSRFGYVVGSGMGPRVGGGGRGTGEGAVKKRSFLEALVEDETAKAYAKKKFVGEVQKKGSSGGKNFYKDVQRKRQRR